MSPRPPRSSAEWTTFALSSLVLAVVVAVIGVRAFQDEAPAAPVARIAAEAREQGGRFFVPVTVGNEGDRTAEAVQVVAELEIEGETVEADEVVDFLAGGDEAEVVFVFDDDPAEGELTVRVAGYVVP